MLVICEVVQKGRFWAPDLEGEGYPDFGHAFQIAVTSEHVPDFGEFGSATSEIRRRKKEERKKKERIPAKT